MNFIHSELTAIDWTLASLPGVGPKSLASLHAVGIFNVWQLLCHAPKRYEDYTQLTAAQDWVSAVDQAAILLEGSVSKVWTYFAKAKRTTYCQLKHGEHHIRVGFFHLHPQLNKQLQQPGVKLRCFGKVVRSANQLTMFHPKYWLVNQDDEPALATTLTPIYPSIAGITASRLRKMMIAALERIAPLTQMTSISEGVKASCTAMYIVHQPVVTDLSSQLVQAKQCLASQEARYWIRHLTIANQQVKSLAPACQASTNLVQEFIDCLDFLLTDDQQAAIEVITGDLKQTIPMRRLLQGDVGCGKTIVATAAMLQAVAAGYQAALLVPTVVLAKQHAQNLQQLLAPLGVKVGLCIADRQASTQDVKPQLQEGMIDLVIGTHALLTETVMFKTLALVVVDEQHRFGVEQRAALLQKNAANVPHALMMSATPIPRSLAQAVFQLHAVSTIKTLPAQRKVINTSLMVSTKRDAVLARVVAQAHAGQQVYWICPLVEGDDTTNYAAMQMYEQIHTQYPAVTVALLHGRLSAEEKLLILDQYAKGAIQLLVSTVVVEVGVDVANANIMVIDQAQQFGLAQLHQLRGRVGRSSAQGYCVLLYDEALTVEGMQRLQWLRECHDGFVLAEKDLNQRGPGQLFGLRQSGCPSWRFLQWPEHKESLVAAQQEIINGQSSEYCMQDLWHQVGLDS